ncbi:MAG: aconitase X catalytic domain-containing protein [Thermodesulfobacteriota bacterium]
MKLTYEEERMLNGSHGSGVAKAMDMIVKWGEVFDAERLVDVTSTHTLLGEPVEWLEEVSSNAVARTFSTLHVTNFDYQRWERQGIKASWAERQMAYTDKCLPCYERLGCVKTFSCGPYLIGNVPKFGDYVNWSGTSGVLLANSLFGARCPRVGSPGSMVSAITGKAPLVGHMLNENRRGQILVKPEGLDPNTFTKEEFGLYGLYTGGVTGEKNNVFMGITRRLSLEEVKFLASPLGVSGSASMFHIVGFTPEAPTLEAAFHDRPPENDVKVGPAEMNKAWAMVNTAGGDDVDLVALGCPHFSITEFKETAACLEGRKIKDGKRLWVSCGLDMYNIAARMGLVQIIEKAGGTVLTGCCGAPLTPWDQLVEPVKVVATNSTRAAGYVNGITRGQVKTKYGRVADCLDSIITGQWRDTGRWAS